MDESDDIEPFSVEAAADWLPKLVGMEARFVQIRASHQRVLFNVISPDGPLWSLDFVLTGMKTFPAQWTIGEPRLECWKNMKCILFSDVGVEIACQEMLLSLPTSGAQSNRRLSFMNRPDR